MKLRFKPVFVMVVLVALVPVLGLGALDLDYSEPATGAQGVSRDVEISLEFTKNVIDEDLQELNRSQIVLLDNEGAVVPVDIQMADRQMQPELRRNIRVVPRRSLDAGETYVVVVLPQLTARNRNTLGEPVTVMFQTAE